MARVPDVRAIIPKTGPRAGQGKEPVGHEEDKSPVYLLKQFGTQEAIGKL